MPNIVIRHLNGTKANQVEEVPLQGFREILIGREATAQIRFDVDREDLVSRNHARISRDTADPNGFVLTDLDSRNGTFINRRRIYGTSHVQHGDRIQLGPAGPEFTFELDPAPATRPTRLADQSHPAPPTRDAMVGAGAAVPPGMGENWPVPGPDAPRPVGRATVERMVGDLSTKMKGESRKTMWTAVIGVLVLLVAGAGYFAWQRQQTQLQTERAQFELEKTQTALLKIEEQNEAAIKKQGDLTATIASLKNNRSPEAQKQMADMQKQLEDLKVENAKREQDLKDAKDAVEKTKASIIIPVADKPGGGTLAPPAASDGDLTDEQVGAASVHSVILVEAAWKVTDSGTGGQVYLYHHRNDLGACTQASKSDYLPMFIEDQGVLSPVLSTLPNDGHNTPIVGTTSGSGFIVTGEGFFLTNRHVLAPWRATWNAADFTKQTVGIKVKNNSIVGCISAGEFPSAWIPSEGSKMVVDKMESVMNPRTGTSVQQSTFSDRLKYNPLHTSVQGEAVINVTFAKTTQRYRATSVTLSERHDIALGRVDLPGGGTPVKLFSDSDAIKPGQHVVVMGYPAISPDIFGVEVSRDMFTNKAHLSAIADPTLTTGPVSKVILSGNTVKGVDGYVSGGEVYQLGINTTGAGNSGGPVFDSKGRVIAVFYAGRTGFGASVTYAVPVKFGKELIDNPSILK